MAKTALLLGDYRGGLWHPLRGVDEALEGILNEFTLTICEEYPRLTLQDLQKYDLVIDYVDAWSKRGNADFAGALIGFVAGGGSLLALHNGIIAHGQPEIEQMLGAKFLNHPQHRELNYEVSGSHPITKELGGFTIDEEPYQFEMDNLAQVSMLMGYTLEGKSCPAAWARFFGQGKLVYLSQGHNAKSFENPGFITLIVRSAQWLTGQL